MRTRRFILFLSMLLATVHGLAQEQASRYVDAYPRADSKKGLQVEIVEDALALGIKHAALNVNLSQLIAPHTAPGTKGKLRWRYEEQDYYFDSAYVSRLDRDIQALSGKDVLVNLIILVYESGDNQVNRLMLHPGYDKNAPNRLGAFNTVTTEGQQWLTAAMEFMAQRWSRPDRKFGRVVGYVMGNEVNSHWWWSNMGRVTMPEFADQYHEAVRLAYGAVRRQSSWARVYISLEHHWNMRYQAGDERQSFCGKEFLDYFTHLTREDQRGDFDWHVAFHPYPENLFEPRFWNDKTALPTADTPRITFKNLSVLTDYLSREEMLFQSNPRRVILSEQGFHTPDGPDGEAIQAAAYCYAYKKVESNDAIDAFILHRHVDNPHEGGLRLGLRGHRPQDSNPRPKKKIYKCFKVADTRQWEVAFEFALPIVGLKNWP